jgi:hypothetical protein
MVMTNASGVMNAGHDRYIFNGSGMSSGTYLFRLEAEPHCAVMKMLPVKYGRHFRNSKSAATKGLVSITPILSSARCLLNGVL